MKVVIADDEEHVRTGIELDVDWERFGISERLMAEDGHQAMELIREHNPAILFCDMSMPRMDGVALLRMLREKGWNTQVIVVSGYDDFQYTRAALLASGVDYILKPFKTKDLEEAVSRAVEAYRSNGANEAEDEHENRHRLRLADSLLDEQKLISYLKGEASLQDRTVRSLFHKIGLPLQGLRLACVLPRNKNRLIENRFSGDAGLFHFAVNNISQEILKSYGAHYTCRLDGYQWVIAASPAHDGKDANEFGRQLDKLGRAWRDTLGLEVLQGTDGKEADYTQLLSAIAGSRASLLKRELLKGGASGQLPDMPRFADREVVLLNAVRTGNNPAITEIVESFAAALKSRGSLRLEELQVCTMEANLLLKRAASLFQADKERTDWLLPLWISDPDEWKTELLHRCWEMAEKPGVGQPSVFGMKAVRRYIEQHYNQEITLSGLSETFHFSPRYLAKMFKEHFHTTIITYLTELRIEKAKTLLLHSDMSVCELAGSIGYEDENYFGKVFKKQTGVSPMQFRKQHKP